MEGGTQMLEDAAAAIRSSLAGRVEGRRRGKGLLRSPDP
jgi:hypothetical protein